MCMNFLSCSRQYNWVANSTNGPEHQSRGTVGLTVVSSAKCLPTSIIKTESLVFACSSGDLDTHRLPKASAHTPRSSRLGCCFEFDARTQSPETCAWLTSNGDALPKIDHFQLKSKSEFRTNKSVLTQEARKRSRRNKMRHVCALDSVCICCKWCDYPKSVSWFHIAMAKAKRWK